jgi:PTH1 family peptidyl-tRNA hydrolase
MLLLVGLGNPGSRYARHRHNVGFMAVDAIADAHGFTADRSKFHGEIREGLIGGEKALVLKPSTFMNDSGRSVAAAARFYNIALDQIIVFHDELDLAPGKLKVKCGGGNAGHNGLKSIDAHLGNAFRRVRIGIGHPGDKARVSGYVLGDFSKTDEEWLTPLLDAIAVSAPKLREGDSAFSGAVGMELAPPTKKLETTAKTARSNEPAQDQTAERTGGVFADLLKGFRTQKDEKKD